MEFKYDANGNTISRTIYKDSGPVSRSYTYDTLNRLVSVTNEDGETESYAYDNAGNRLYKQGPYGLTLYLRHGQIAVAMDVEISNGSFPEDTNEEKKYQAKKNRYLLSGDLIAGRVSTIIKEDNTMETQRRYYHLDHLNSTKVVTDKNGEAGARYIYRAFGEQLRKIGEEDAKYTYGGKELDSSSNLYYFNARYYDATLGRFINVDPAQANTNWYVYCSNNPLSFVDPSGLKEKLKWRINWGFEGKAEHHGVDFQWLVNERNMTRGKDVPALKGGEVISTGNDKKGMGNYVKVRLKDGWIASYQHLSGTSVKKGDVIKPGQIIGQGGSTGNSSGGHVHYDEGTSVKPKDMSGIVEKKWGKNTVYYRDPGISNKTLENSEYARNDRSPFGIKGLISNKLDIAEGKLGKENGRDLFYKEESTNWHDKDGKGVGEK